MPTTSETLTREVSAQAEQSDEIFANDDRFNELWEASLEVSSYTQLVVALCTGGPLVEAVADLDSEGAAVSASIVDCWSRETVSQPMRPGTSLCRALRADAETSRMAA